MGVSIELSANEKDSRGGAHPVRTAHLGRSQRA
jgi:hypothetical protein